ncbi:MAG: glycosyltransferase [Kiritimatiellia bacterium]
MQIALLTNIISPHQIPLAHALVARVGEQNYRYFYTEKAHAERSNMGWGTTMPCWCQQTDSPQDEAVLRNVEVLLSGIRAIALFEDRIQRGKKTYYTSERWFKPPFGFLRILMPSYFAMAWRLTRCFQSLQFQYLPMGVHAARDMARLYGLLHGDFRCIFQAPKIAFESRPGGRILLLRQAIKMGLLSSEERAFGRRHGFVQIPKGKWEHLPPSDKTCIFDKMKMWGYFVAPGQGHVLPIKHPPKVLWVGRMLNWKHVAVLVRACRSHQNLKHVAVSLSLYGHGPEEKRLKKVAGSYPTITFHDFIPVEEVRRVMQQHDIYVLPSNGYEGWGAVVNEALEEGMRVLATYESGAGATVLPPSNLFHAGDIKRLSALLANPITPYPIGLWTAQNAAEALQELIGGRP